VTNEVLLVLHVSAVVMYLGGGLLFHGSLRRALRHIPPGQASIIGSKVGNDFTYISWLSLTLWGVTGYWMLSRMGWVDGSAPLTLFLDPGTLGSRPGVSMLIMLTTWYLLVVNGFIITFVYRPRLSKRVPAGAGADEATELADTVGTASRRIDVLATVNLGLTAVGFVSGAVFL